MDLDKERVDIATKDEYFGRVDSTVHLPCEDSDEGERMAILSEMNKQALHATLQNLLEGKPPEALIRDAKRFARDNDMLEHEEDLIKGALVAQKPDDFKNIPVR
jgi:hypothetical protein